MNDINISEYLFEDNTILIFPETFKHSLKKVKIPDTVDFIHFCQDIKYKFNSIKYVKWPKSLKGVNFNFPLEEARCIQYFYEKLPDVKIELCTRLTLEEAIETALKKDERYNFIKNFKDKDEITLGSFFDNFNPGHFLLNNIFCKYVDSIKCIKFNYRSHELPFWKYEKTNRDLSDFEFIKFEKINWPSTIETFEFGNEFNESIEKVIWPKTLKNIIFWNRFFQNIENINWPSSLKSIIFRRYFDQPIEKVKWPSTLESIDLSIEFNQPIEKVNWPSSLNNLVLCGRFDQPFEKLNLPSSLKKLKLGNESNQPLEKVNWPSSLQELELFSEINDGLENVNWPETLENLYISDVNKPLMNLPPFLKKLRIGTCNKDIIEKSKIPFGCNVIVR